MNSKDVDFSSADLGLKNVVDEEDSNDDFDAFNADTFGSEEVWHEDDHEELAKCTEEERTTHPGGEDGFFDFGESVNPPRHQNGNHETYSHQQSENTDSRTSFSREDFDGMRGGISLDQTQHHIEDPAILNVVHRQQMQFTNQFAANRLPQPSPVIQPMSMHSHSRHTGDLIDPAIMSMMSQAPMRHPQQSMTDIFQRFPGMPNPNGSARTLDEIERQMTSEQAFPHNIQQQMAHRMQQMSLQHHPMRQLPYLQHQQLLHNQRLQYQNRMLQGPPPQMAYQFTVQQQRGGFPGGRSMNFPNHQPRNRNPFDDRNRETFGDDFVHHHVQEQRQNRETNHLITPGHVHVLGILRGARNREHASPNLHAESTGNPRRDLEIQRLMTHQRMQDCEEQLPGDEYAGLMTPKEKQWIINIQLNQLKCENPFLDDYYYTVFKLRREHKLDDKKGIGQLGPPGGLVGRSEEVSGPKRDEEGTHLLIQPDSPRVSYMPQQFTNSLGKLQAATVKAPRKIIDVGIVNSEGNDSVAQKESRNFKLTLLELERMYDLLIEVEDCEKKLFVLPTNTPMRQQVEMERCEAVKKFSANLTVGQRLKRYLMVRKGKILMKRGLRLLDPLQMGILCTNLLQHFSSILKRDREEQLLREFWSNGLSTHLLSAPLDFVIHYLSILTQPSYSLKAVVASTLGCSIVLTLVHQCAVLLSDENQRAENDVQGILKNLGFKISECTSLSGPLSNFPFLLPQCNLPDDCVNQILRLKNSSQAPAH